MPIKRNNWSAVYASGEVMSLLDDMLEVPSTREDLRKEYYYRKVLDLAKARGYKCLSKEYVSSIAYMKFQCSNGHNIKVKPSYFINNDYECPKCKKAKRKIEKIKEIRKKAREFGWRCLTTYYTTNPMKFKCGCGRIVMLTAQSLFLKKTKFCNACRREHQKNEYLKKFKANLELKGGKIVGEYKCSHTSVKIQCADGHVFSVIPTSVVHDNSWCPECRKKEINKEKMVRAAKVAANNGGLCFSRDFEDGNLLWKCRNGHVFNRPYEHVLRGLWCYECSKKKKDNLRTKELEIGVQRKAALNNVALVGSLLIGHDKKNEWICSNGHRFVAAYRDLKDKEIWCPLCSIKHQLGETVDKNEDNLPDYEKAMYGRKKSFLREDYVTKVRGIPIQPTMVVLQMAKRSGHNCGCCERILNKGEMYLPPFQMAKLTGEKYDFDHRVCSCCFELG